MRVLVCGGRYYSNIDALYGILDSLEPKPTLIIEGGAEGADAMAHNWAGNRSVATMRFPADWGKDGKAAGPIRNRRMIQEGKPDLVVAFEGGKGTANMVEQARKAGVRVIEVDERPHELLVNKLANNSANTPNAGNEINVLQPPAIIAQKG